MSATVGANHIRPFRRGRYHLPRRAKRDNIVAAKPRLGGIRVYENESRRSVAKADEVRITTRLRADAKRRAKISAPTIPD